MSANNKHVTRREFLKDAAVMSAGVATAGVLSSATAPAAQAAAGVPDKWDMETEVLIVGSGYAGLCAAIEAVDAGAKALIVEKNVIAGGNSILCAGNAIFGGGTHVQVAAGLKDTPELFAQDVMAYGEYRAVPELVNLFSQKSPECVKWLEGLGVKWSKTVGTNEGMTINRSHAADVSPDYPGVQGMAYWTVLYKAVQKRNVNILLKHRMTRVIRSDKGPVLGIEVNADGKTLNIKANKAVVLASGGWKGNVYMRLAWDPRLDADLAAGGAPYIETTGDGVNAAVDIGAALTDMSFVCEFRFKWGTKVYQLWEPQSLTQVTGASGLSVADYQKMVMVRGDGKRFVNEMAANEYPQQPFYEAFLNLKERPRIVWGIVDKDGAAALKWQVDSFKDPQPLKPPALSPDTVAVADTLEDLAKKINVPAAALADTIKRYNGFVDAGKDDDFKKPKPTSKIANGPFYAAKLQFFAHDQMGGIRANTKGQVIERSEQTSVKPVQIDQQKIIPNLYAAGEIVGGYVGAERGHGKISIYMVYGRIAGKNAAMEKGPAV